MRTALPRVSASATPGWEGSAETGTTGRIMPAGVSSEQLQQLQAGDAGQIHVHDEGLDPHMAEDRPRRGGVVDHRGTPAGHVVEQRAQQFGDRCVVLHHQDADGGRERSCHTTAAQGQPACQAGRP